MCLLVVFPKILLLKGFSYGLSLLEVADVIANNFTANFDGFCGTFLVATNRAAAASTIFKQRMPFELGIYTDGEEVDAAAAPTEASVGFYIYYNQVACR